MIPGVCRMDGEEPEEEIDDEIQEGEGLEIESEIIEEQTGRDIFSHTHTHTGWLALEQVLVQEA